MGNFVLLDLARIARLYPYVFLNPREHSWQALAATNA